MKTATSIDHIPSNSFVDINFKSALKTGPPVPIKELLTLWQLKLLNNNSMNLTRKESE